MRKITQLIVHHTASLASPGKQQLAGVDRFHKDKDWGGGARAKKSRRGYYTQYHYFIEESGETTQTADHDEIRWHAGSQNTDSLGLCMAGAFDPGGNEAPTQAQAAALQKLLRELSGQYAIKPERIFPHRQYAKKSCYGRNIPDDWARNLTINKKKGTAMFFQITGTTGVWAFYEGVWIFVANDKDWKASWPEAKLVHISEQEFNQWPQAINTLK